MSLLLGQGSAVVVLGMHRTGTSLTMAAVEALGVDAGSHLLPPGPDNEIGYWEDKSILDLNERLLAAMDKTWFSVAPVAESDWSRPAADELRREAAGLLRRRFANSALWGFKDPRTLRLLPFWQDVLRDLGATVKYVVSFRNPDSVAASLAHRNHFSSSHSYYLWLSHYLPFLDRLLKETCLFVNYDHLIDDPRQTVRRMEYFIHGASEVPGQADRERIDAFLESTLQENLRHTRFESEQVNVDAPTLVRDTFRLLDRLAAAGDISRWDGEVQDLQARYRDDSLLLQQLDDTEAEAGRLRRIIREEEPIRDKIEKMGLYQADLHNKMERTDALHVEQLRLGKDLEARISDIQEKVAVQIDEMSRCSERQAQVLASLEARAEDIQEKVVVQIDEMSRRSERQAQVLASLEARTEDIQEKVVVQIDELHRAIAAMLNPADAKGLRVNELPRDLADAQAQIETIYRSTSWRITRPLRAAKMFAVRIRSGFRR